MREKRTKSCEEYRWKKTAYGPVSPFTSGPTDGSNLPQSFDIDDANVLALRVDETLLLKS